MTGAPVPAVSWYKDKQLLEQSERMQMATEEETGVCRLEIREATAEDSGQYTVQLNNQASQPPAQ